MKKRSGSSAIVKDIVIVAIGIAIIWIGLRVAFGTENPFYVVSSGSMVPNLNVFDVIVIQGNVPFEHIKIGDIIVFKSAVENDRVIVHRVAEILDESPRILRTKGDANPGSIPGVDFPITKLQYLGKVEYVIPQIGYVTRILTPPINYIIIAVIIGIMIVKQYGKSKSASSHPDKPPMEDKFDPPNPPPNDLNKIHDNEYASADKSADSLNSNESTSVDKSADISNSDKTEQK